MHVSPRCSECQVCLGQLLDGHTVTHLRVCIVMIYDLSCNLVTFSCHLRLIFVISVTSVDLNRYRSSLKLLCTNGK